MADRRLVLVRAVGTREAGFASPALVRSSVTSPCMPAMVAITARVEGIGPGQAYVYQCEHGPERPDPLRAGNPMAFTALPPLPARSFTWHDQGWTGLELADLILYEMHVGTFTPEGTFDFGHAGLDRLVAVGVNALEVMPIAQFPGGRNWGYDGVYPFAVQTTYGGIGASSASSMRPMPEASPCCSTWSTTTSARGQLLPRLRPLLQRSVSDALGRPAQLRRPGQRRRARLFPGQRPALAGRIPPRRAPPRRRPAFIKDFSASHILAEIADQAVEARHETGRRFHTIGESDLNDARILRPPERRPRPLVAVERRLPSRPPRLPHRRRAGYYADHGPWQMSAAYRDAFVLTGAAFALSQTALRRRPTTDRASSSSSTRKITTRSATDRGATDSAGW